jgi:hypothetical protein
MIVHCFDKITHVETGDFADVLPSIALGKNSKMVHSAALVNVPLDADVANTTLAKESISVRVTTSRALPHCFDVDAEVRDLEDTE